MSTASISILGKEFVFMSDDLPKILLVCGPCRSGTTAFANNFTIAGMESHMQPIKSILRERSAGEDTIPQQIVFNHPEVILIKETFGAEQDVELFNPVSILLEGGYPASKIKVVGLMRDPIAAFDSWMRLWGKVDERIFTGAYHLMTSIREESQRLGVTFLPYVPEVIACNDSRGVLRAVASFFGLSPSVGDATEWQGTPKFGDQDDRLAHLHFYDAPPEKFIRGVREWGGYTFRDTTRSHDHPVSDSTRAIYQSFRSGCEEVLHLTV